MQRKAAAGLARYRQAFSEAPALPFYGLAVSSQICVVKS